MLTKVITKKYLDDLFVEKCLVIELKSVSELNNAFEAGQMCLTHLSQIVYSTYMKLLKAPKGVLINFNCSNIFAGGQKTFVNEYFKILNEK